MAEYLIKDTTLIDIADKTRAISGTTGKLMPSEIKLELDEASQDIDSQETLIAQIIAALESKIVKTITFSIDGINYSAIEGMTWKEWCISEYNTHGFFIDGTYVSTGVYRVAMGLGDYVHISDKIIANQPYIRTSSGGSDN